MTTDKPYGRRPDYNLKVKAREGNDQTTVGCGWANPDGSISIKIYPAVDANQRCGNHGAVVAKRIHPRPAQVRTQRGRPVFERRSAILNNHPATTAYPEFLMGVMAGVVVACLVMAAVLYVPLLHQPRELRNEQAH